MKKKKTEFSLGTFNSELQEQEIQIPDGYEASIEGGNIIFRKKESEDEKIRKMLVRYFKGYKEGCETFNGIPTDNILDWLERQGKHAITCSEEQMKVLDEVLTFAANHENPYWNDYIFDTLNNLIRQLKV